MKQKAPTKRQLSTPKKVAIIILSSVVLIGVVGYSLALVYEDDIRELAKAKAERLAKEEGNSSEEGEVEKIEDGDITDDYYVSIRDLILDAQDYSKFQELSSARRQYERLLLNKKRLTEAENLAREMRPKADAEIFRLSEEINKQIARHIDDESLDLEKWQRSLLKRMLKLHILSKIRSEDYGDVFKWKYEDNPKYSLEGLRLQANMLNMEYRIALEKKGI